MSKTNTGYYSRVNCNINEVRFAISKMVESYCNYAIKRNKEQNGVEYPMIYFGVCEDKPSKDSLDLETRVTVHLKVEYPEGTKSREKDKIRNAIESVS